MDNDTKLSLTVAIILQELAKRGFRKFEFIPSGYKTRYIRALADDGAIVRFEVYHPDSQVKDEAS